MMEIERKRAKEGERGRERESKSDVNCTQEGKMNKVKIAYICVNV